MSAASTLTKNLLLAYKNIVKIKAEHSSKKLKAMKAQHPTYKLFDFEHPYHDMEETAKTAEKQMKETIKAVLDVDIDGSTVRNELNKMTVVAVLGDKQPDAIVKKLRKL